MEMGGISFLCNRGLLVRGRPVLLISYSARLEPSPGVEHGRRAEDEAGIMSTRYFGERKCGHQVDGDGLKKRDDKKRQAQFTNIAVKYGCEFTLLVIIHGSNLR